MYRLLTPVTGLELLFDLISKLSLLSAKDKSVSLSHLNVTSPVKSAFDLTSLQLDAYKLLNDKVKDC